MRWGACVVVLGVALLPRAAGAVPDVAITGETLSQRFTTAVATASYAHPVPTTGANRLLVVTLGVTDANVITSIRWDPDGTDSSGDEQTLTCPAALNISPGGGRRMAICHLTNPTTGTGGRVRITMATAATFTSSATTFTGVAGVAAGATSGTGRFFNNWAGCSLVDTGYDCTVTVTTAADDVVFDLAAQGQPTDTTTRSFTPGLGQTLRQPDSATLNAGSNLAVATSTKIATGTSTVMTWAYRGTGCVPAVPCPQGINSVGHVTLVLTAASSVTAAAVGPREAVSFGSAGTRVSWQTEEEVSHLGFHVWRQDSGQLARVTPGLVPGAMFATGDAPLGGGRQYTTWDDGGSPGARYWLEEIATRGPPRWHGPMIAGRGDVPAGLGLRRLAATEAPARLARRVSPAAMPAPFRSSYLRQQPPVAGCANPAASVAAVKIGVTTPGWIRVDGQTLRSAGLPANAVPARLALYADGQEIAMRVAGTSEVEAVEFYGLAVDGRETGTRVYWLVEAAGAGPRRRVGAAPAGPAGYAVDSYVATQTLRERSTYFAALLNGRESNFFGAVVSAAPVRQRLDITAPILDVPATLDVALQGVSADGHGVRVDVNGTPLGSVVWAGRVATVQTLPVPAGVLSPGMNEVVLTPEPAAGVALVDHLTFTYQRHARAIADVVEAAVAAGATARMTGFSSADIAAFDVTDADAPVELAVTVDAAGDGFAASLSLPRGRGQRIVRALTPLGRTAPAFVTANRPSQLCAGAGAELTIIAPGGFFDALAPFVAARRAQGWSVELADVEDVFDEMTHGEHRADAITDFIRVRRAGAAPATKYLLLVGDASVDPRDFLGKRVADVVPTRLIDTDVLETASDDALADLDGDGMPEIAVGRWPARTADEVAALVSNTLAIDVRAPFDRGALIVTSSRDLNFPASAAQVGAALPAPADVLDTTGLGAGSARSALVAAWSRAPSFVQYFGHGSQGIWQGLLSMDGLADLGRPGQRSVVAAMTCLNGLFHDVHQDSMAERLLLAPGGAVAVWASADLDNAGAQGVLAARFVERARTLALGEAVRMARVDTGGAGRAMVLFGDPTLFGQPTSPNVAITAGARPTPWAQVTASPATPATPHSGCAVAAGAANPATSFAFAALAAVGLLLRRTGGK
jgi:hypothetical protein